MQPITTGIAAIRASVRIFGRDRVLVGPRVVAMFIRLTNTAEARRSTLGTPLLMIPGRRRPYDSGTRLARLGVEKLENLAGAFGADARNLAEVGDRGPLDLLQCSEMMEQGTFP